MSTTKINLKKAGPLLVIAAVVGGVWVLLRKAETEEEPLIPSASGEFSLIAVDRGIGIILSSTGVSSTSARVQFSGKVTAGNTPIPGLRLILRQLMGDSIFSTDTIDFPIELTLGETHAFSNIIASTPITEIEPPGEIKAVVILESYNPSTGASIEHIGTITSPALGTVEPTPAIFSGGFGIGE